MKQGRVERGEVHLALTETGGCVGIALILTQNNSWVRVWTCLGLWVGELCFGAYW